MSSTGSDPHAIRPDAAQPEAAVQPGVAVQPEAAVQPGVAVQPEAAVSQGAAVSPGADPQSGAAVPPEATGASGAALSEREMSILAFERRWWRHAGAKEQAIRDAFGLSATRYYQLLNALLDNPAALVAEPVLVGRLRRLRSTRARSRGSAGQPRPDRSPG